MKNQLTQLGLTEYEAAVYLAVLELGPCNAGPLVKQTKLHRMNVYSSLKKLEDLNLISVFMKNNRQQFQATNPDNILAPLKEQEILAKQLIPQLNALKSKQNKEMGVQILYGTEGFWLNIQEIAKSAGKTDKIMRIIGGAPDSEFYKAIEPHYSEYQKLLQKSKVAKWLLSPREESANFKEKFTKEDKKNRLKTAPGMRSPTYTRITPEMVSIELYTTPLMIIQIKNKAVASSYLEQFDLLWKSK